LPELKRVFEMTRSKGIGGSDVAPILGLSPWKTAYQVYQEKIGESDGVPDNPQMAYGRMMEPTIRQWYSNETGRSVTVPETVLAHPKHPFVLGSLDGITQDRRVIEIKTARSGSDWGEPGTDQIPTYYMPQVQQYMMVTGYVLCDVVVSISGTMPRIFEVPADAELQAMILEADIDFWRMVQDRTPPDPVSFADMMARFGRVANASTTMASQEGVAAWNLLKDVRARLKDLETEEEELKAILMGELGENDTLLGFNEKTIATWKMSKGTTTFDAKRMQSEEPETYNRYLVNKPGSRLFLIK
jgi:putative phage-type endonuclease